MIGVFNNFDDLIQQMSKDQQHREAIAEYGVGSAALEFCNHSEQSSLLLNGSFLFFQLFIHLLLEMKPPANAKEELINLCRESYAGNAAILDVLKEFDRDYTPTTALFWYTKQSCFYRIINKALRQHDVETLISCCFFIIDLNEQLKREQITFLTTASKEGLLRVYRGQLLTTAELHRMQENLGEFLSMNSFLSTSQSEETALMFTTTIGQCPSDIRPVLFRIEIDTRMDTKPYSNISHLSQFSDENEVLIMAGAMFRIISMTMDSEKQIWIVNLSMCSENEHELREVFDHYKRSSVLTEGVGFVLLGNLLAEMGRTDQAAILYKKQLSFNEDDTLALSGLGQVAVAQEQLELAMAYHERALEIDLDRAPGSPKLAIDYMHLGNAFRGKGQHEIALQYYKNSLEILLRLYGEEHQYVAFIYAELGYAYKLMNHLKESFDYRQKYLAIQEKLVPSNHPQLGDVYFTVGWSYDDMGETDKAFEYFQKAYAIRLKSIPRESYGMTHIYYALGYTHVKMNNDDQALSNLHQALSIAVVALPANHNLPPHAHFQLGIVYERKKDYVQAHGNYARATELFKYTKLCQHIQQANASLGRMTALMRHSDEIEPVSLEIDR